MQQQQDLMEYILSRKGFNKSQNKSSDAVSLNSVMQNDLPRPLTEIWENSLYFCLEERKVCVDGRKIDLTVKEFDALHLLIMNPKRVMTFETISYQIWGEEYVGVSVKAIHNIMSRLRQKLQTKLDMPEYIVSIRGVGYKFEA